jgi:hypothetical protein
MNYTFIILNTSNYGAHYKLAVNKYSALTEHDYGDRSVLSTLKNIFPWLYKEIKWTFT